MGLIIFNRLLAKVLNTYINLLKNCLSSRRRTSVCVDAVSNRPIPALRNLNLTILVMMSKLYITMNRLLVEVCKRERVKSERIKIFFPFPFNLYPFPQLLQNISQRISPNMPPLASKNRQNCDRQKHYLSSPQ
jgi:hypothetical protein